MIIDNTHYCYNDDNDDTVLTTVITMITTDMILTTHCYNDDNWQYSLLL